MNKGGAAHIEIIISTLMFLTFISAGLLIIKPTNINHLSDSILRYSELGIKQYASEIIKEYSIVVYDSYLPENKIIKIKLDEIKDSSKINVEFPLEEENKIISYEIYPENGVIVLERTDQWKSVNNPDFFYLRIGEIFEDGETKSGSPGFEHSFYNISSVREIRVYSEKRIRELSEQYNNNYENVKKVLGISDNFDFDFTLIMENNDGTYEKIEASKNAPIGLNVYSEKKRIIVYRELNRNIEFADIIVRAW